MPGMSPCSESVDWGHPALNRSEGFLGADVVTQSWGYPKFDLMKYFLWEVALLAKKAPAGLLRVDKSQIPLDYYTAPLMMALHLCNVELTEMTCL